MAATLRDVARLEGVSFKTVSNVINDHPYVADTTRACVLEAIEQLGYRPNRLARSLRSGRTGAIGLAVPELSLAYFAELADEVITVADKHDVVVLIEPTGGNRQRELEVLSGSRRQMTDGLNRPVPRRRQGVRPADRAGPVADAPANQVMPSAVGRAATIASIASGAWTRGRSARTCPGTELSAQRRVAASCRGSGRLGSSFALTITGLPLSGPTADPT